MESSSQHPNKNDVEDLMRNRNHPGQQADVEHLPGPDTAAAGSSATRPEERMEDDPVYLYELGVPQASPPQ